jgi:dolichol-phosphate mannosyltransferase
MTTLASGRDLRSRVQAAWAPTLVVLVLIYATGLQYLVSGLPGLGYSRYLNDLPVAWRDLSRSVGAAAAAYSRESHNEVLIVGMDRYAIASELAFYGTQQSHSTVETSNSHLFEGMGLMYSRWTPANLQEHRNLLLVSWDPGDLQGRYVEAHAQRLGPLESGVLTRDGATIRTYYYRMAYDYRSLASGAAIDLK